MAKRKFQWHPLFARLLRPHLEGYYELQTGVPVGDLPPQADIVLLRRTTPGALPFQGLGRWLTTWNILEFKGPTVVPRQRDLPLLVELGLDIDRRLNAERVRQGKRALRESEVSFWYIANKLGRHFCQVAGRRLGDVEACGPGVWRATVLGYPCLLVSTVNLPVDEDSFPLHVVGIGPREKQQQVGLFMLGDRERFHAYGNVFSSLHPKIWEEVKAMARNKREKREWDLRPTVEYMGLDKVIELLGKKKVLEQLDVDDILANLSPAKRRELQRRLQAEQTKELAKRT